MPDSYRTFTAFRARGYTALFTALSDFTALCTAPTAERKSRKSL